ncbi:hypothetical protein KHQ84_gp216 [Rhodococcus phage Finch]|uniref:Uncharacterized protein n=1 Tax=Rhodococcus phage Finch TaxID=2094144 RepID=A0A2P1JXT8_9CAUD|nr:hypothetical protein KHQ84_gp216 [Rhodococcus phage Finch]AVO25135.1 hypothetical protein SEA_FINCH_216 [Rhodococcus phage Finch]
MKSWWRRAGTALLEGLIRSSAWYSRDPQVIVMLAEQREQERKDEQQRRAE